MAIYRITVQVVNDGEPGEVVDIVEMESQRETPSSWQLWQDYREAQREEDLIALASKSLAEELCR